MQPKKQITMRFLAQPTDVNFGGKVHGGTMMKWIDEAAYACAAQWSGHYCVTAHIGDVAFNNPVKIGSLVEIQAHIVHTGNSSMHIAVQVRSKALTDNEKSSRAIHCLLIFVALDNDGHPVAVPTFVAKTDLEKQQQNYAINLLKFRRALYEDIGGLTFKIDSSQQSMANNR